MRGKDVCLPTWILITGLVFVSLGIVFQVCWQEWLVLICSSLIGLAAILCWANQWVIIVDEQTFISSTMFGIKRTVRFCDIVKYKISTGRSPDGWLTTRFCRVFIESNAYISKRFAQAVNASLPAVGTDRLMANEKK